MPVIKTIIDQRTYDRLVHLRKQEGMPSVSALFLNRCDLLTDAGQASEIVRRAVKLAKAKPRGTEFRLCDLFASHWEEFGKGARLRAGKLFYGKIAAAKDGIRPSRKSASNHQMYLVA
jgi:hypothetical protein